MKLTVAISLVAHVIVIGLLDAHLPSAAHSIVTMDLFDRAAPPTARPAPATDLPIATQTSARAPRPHVRRLARAMPPMSPPAPPIPTLPEPEPAATPAPDTSGATDGADITGEGPPTDLQPGAPGRVSLRRDPDLEPGSCVRGLEHPSPGGKRYEVVVRLRLVLDDKGRVGEVALVQPAGDGFDDIAVQAVRAKCRFSPALDERGRPVPFVIDEFRFRFPPAGMGIFSLQ